MFRATVIAVACYLAMGETAMAFEDGNTLLEDCQAAQRVVENRVREDDDVKASGCLGFVAGATDTLTMTRNICLPKGAPQSRQQIIDIIMLWLRNHPEKRHDAAAALIMIALKEKFPCN